MTPIKYLPIVLLFSAVSGTAGDIDVRLVNALKNAHTDRAAIGTLLKQKIDLNAQEADGTTALHWAARWDDLETANSLIQGGANAKAPNRYGVTPLSLACINGNMAMIELLLKAGADPNRALPGGETPLMTAARTGKVDAVKALLTHGADPNVKENVRGQTALMWAAAEGNTGVVETLIEHGANLHLRSNGGFSAFLFAARSGRLGASKALLKAGVEVNETLESPSGVPETDPAFDENKIQIYNGHGLHLPISGTTGLVLAVENAHYELAAALLDAGADPDAGERGWTALHQISWVRKPGTGLNDPPPAGDGNMDSLEFVRRLVAHGANINARMTKKPDVLRTEINLIGATPFFMAARTADVPLMRILAELGANPLTPNADNSPPILAAAGVGTKVPGEDPGSESEVLEAVQVALQLGNDVNAVDNNGETAMHGAAYKDVPRLVQLLVDKGAKIEIWNRKNSSGWTPLRMAEGIHVYNRLRSSAAVAAALREVMIRAGVSTVVEPEVYAGSTRFSK